jgi:excisionase family DNA binding protein
MSERLLTAEEVAELLALLESWVREATPEGRIPYLALGRYRRYERAAIEAWLAEQRGGPSVKTAPLGLEANRPSLVARVLKDDIRT